MPVPLMNAICDLLLWQSETIKFRPRDLLCHGALLPSTLPHEIATYSLQIVISILIHYLPTKNKEG